MHALSLELDLRLARGTGSQGQRGHPVGPALLALELEVLPLAGPAGLGAARAARRHERPEQQARRRLRAVEDAEAEVVRGDRVAEIRQRCRRTLVPLPLQLVVLRA